jgi:hypothetical protein
MIDGLSRFGAFTKVVMLTAVLHAGDAKNCLWRYVSCRIDRRRRAKSGKRKGLSMIGNSSTA